MQTAILIHVKWEIWQNSSLIQKLRYCPTKIPKALSFETSVFEIGEGHPIEDKIED